MSKKVGDYRIRTRPVIASELSLKSLPGTPWRTLGALLLIVALASCGGSEESGPTGTGDTTSQPSVAITHTDGNSVSHGGDEPTEVRGRDTSKVETQAADPAYQATMNARSQSPPTSAPAPTFGPSSFDSNGDGWYTYEELREAILAVLNTYTWPPNYPVSAEFIRSAMANPPNGDPLFQVGSEYTALSTFHECGWWQTWLDAKESGDSNLEAQALDQILNVVPTSPTLDPGSAEHLRGIAAKAQLGDATGVISLVEANCQGNNLPPRVDAP